MSLLVMIWWVWHGFPVCFFLQASSPLSIESVNWIIWICEFNAKSTNEMFACKESGWRLHLFIFIFWNSSKKHAFSIKKQFLEEKNLRKNSNLLKTCETNERKKTQQRAAWNELIELSMLNFAYRQMILKQHFVLVAALYDLIINKWIWLGHCFLRVSIEFKEFFLIINAEMDGKFPIFCFEIIFLPTEDFNYFSSFQMLAMRIVWL